MDRRLEPVRLPKVAAGLTLSAILFVAFLWPAWKFFGEALYTFNVASISSVYLLVLIRSVLFSMIQALLSTSIALSVGAVVALCFLQTKGMWAQNLSKLSTIFGILGFSLPTFLIAMSQMELSRKLGLSFLGQGFIAIIFCHAALNVFFVSTALLKRTEMASTSEVLDQFGALLSLGATGRSFLRHGLWPLWSTELRSLGYLIFVWSFSAFSTLLLLGGSVKYSNPELLLYFSLQNDFDSTRIFLISILQLTSAVFLYRFCSRIDVGAKSFEFSDQSRSETIRTFFLRHLRLNRLLIVVGVLLGSFFALPYVHLFLGSLTSFKINMFLDTEFRSAFINSIFYALLAFLLTYIFGLMFLLASQRLRKAYTMLSGVSVTLIASLWMSQGWDLLSDSSYVQILLAAVALGFCQSSFLALWIERRLSSIQVDVIGAAKTMGANSFALSRRIYFPACRDLLRRYSIGCAALALGELSLANLFLRDADLLANLARKLSARYDFASASGLSLFLLLIACVLIYVGEESKRVKL